MLKQNLINYVNAFLLGERESKKERDRETETRKRKLVLGWWIGMIDREIEKETVLFKNLRVNAYTNSVELYSPPRQT